MYLEERINDIKRELNVNNKQLEERLGLSNGYIGDIENGKNKNPSKIITALYEILRISPSWIYSGEGEMFLSTGTAVAPDTRKFRFCGRRFRAGAGNRGKTSMRSKTISSRLRLYRRQRTQRYLRSAYAARVWSERV